MFIRAPPETSLQFAQQISVFTVSSSIFRSRASSKITQINTWWTHVSHQGSAATEIMDTLFFFPPHTAVQHWAEVRLGQRFTVFHLSVPQFKDIFIHPPSEGATETRTSRAETRTSRDKTRGQQSWNQDQHSFARTHLLFTLQLAQSTASRPRLVGWLSESPSRLVLGRLLKLMMLENLHV